VLPYQQVPRIRYCFVELAAGFFVKERLLRFCEAIKGIGGGRVGGFVGVDQEGFGPVALFDVGVGDARLEVEDGVGV